MQRQVASFANRSRYQNHRNNWDNRGQNDYKNKSLGESDHPMRIMRLNIKSIRMDDYQRDVNNTKVDRIVASYDIHRDRPIEISYRNGEYWCFDGQHRVRAHEKMGNTTILAQVHYGLTYHDEAALFAKQHENEQHVSVRDRWKASVKAGNKIPETKEIISICKEQGFEIADHSDTNPNVISCINEVQKIYSKHGVNGMRTMLWVIRTAWDNEIGATHRDIVAGIGRIMNSFKLDDAGWNRLRDKLAETTPKKFMRSMKTRGGKASAICMVQMYNKNLRKESNRLNEYLIK